MITQDTTRNTQTFKFSRKLNTKDGTQDYIIPVDQVFYMCWAINYNMANFTQHQDRGNFPMYLMPDGKVLFSTSPFAANTTNGTDTTAGNETVIGTTQPYIPHEFYVAHGVTLYVAWTILGFVILASKRYLPAPFFPMHAVHALSGFIVLIMTFSMSLATIEKYGW